MKNKSALLPLLLLALSLLLGGCKESSSPLAPKPQPPPPPSEIWNEFSGEKAFEHTRQQVELGPRSAGSAALEETRKLIISSLEANGWSVERQTFTDETPRGPVEFVNLIARYGGKETTQRFIVSSHYDTKLYDTITFVGASDGASSTGALMELARVLALDPEFASQIELVFFDGEEAFEQFTPTDGLYGSRHYAADLRNSGRNKQFRAGILWDMIGDKDLTITLPPDSPPFLVSAIFKAAEELGVRKHFGYAQMPIWDDHVPLNQAKIPTIDLIDFQYPYWHTADDTLDKLSPESLQIVGSVTLRYLKTAIDPNLPPLSPPGAPTPAPTPDEASASPSAEAK